MPRENDMMGHNQKFEIPKEMGAWVLNDPNNITIKKNPYLNLKRVSVF